MVADLVGDHIRPGEVARRAQPALHVAVEAQVEVHPLVCRAVERADGGGGVATAGGDRVAVEHDLGPVEGLALRGEEFLPGVQRAREDVGAEIPQVALRILRGRDAATVRGRSLRRLPERVVHGECSTGPGAARQHLEQEEHDHPRHAEAARERDAGTQAAAGSHATATGVDQIRAAPSFATPAHP